MFAKIIKKTNKSVDIPFKIDEEKEIRMDNDTFLEDADLC